MFELMSKYLKPSKFGKWEITNKSYDIFENGRTHCELWNFELFERTGVGEMSDSIQDFEENRSFIEYAIGKNNVLIIGLGLGCVPFYLQNKVNKIDIVEIDKDLISHITSNVPFNSNVNIINEDGYNYKAVKKYYDAILVDISSTIDEDINKLLSKRYEDALVNNGKIFWWGAS